MKWKGGKPEKGMLGMPGFNIYDKMLSWSGGISYLLNYFWKDLKYTEYDGLH